MIKKASLSMHIAYCKGYKEDKIGGGGEINDLRD